MLIELKEESWEYNRLPKIEKRLGKKYIKEFNDRFYIDLDDLYNLIGLLEDDLDYDEEVIKEFDEKLNEMNRERKCLQVGVSKEY